MLLEEFDYTLPPELIAQRPLAERDGSRMMVIDRAAKRYEDRAFRRDFSAPATRGSAGFQ